MKMVSILNTHLLTLKSLKAENISHIFYSKKKNGIFFLFFSPSLADKIESIMFLYALKILYVCHVIYSISYTYYMF